MMQETHSTDDNGDERGGLKVVTTNNNKGETAVNMDVEVDISPPQLMSHESRLGYNHLHNSDYSIESQFPMPENGYGYDNGNHSSMASSQIVHNSNKSLIPNDSDPNSQQPIARKHSKTQSLGAIHLPTIDVNWQNPNLRVHERKMKSLELLQMEQQRKTVEIDGSDQVKTVKRRSVGALPAVDWLPDPKSLTNPQPLPDQLFTIDPSLHFKIATESKGVAPTLPKHHGEKSDSSSCYEISSAIDVITKAKHSGRSRASVDFDQEQQIIESSAATTTTTANEHRSLADHLKDDSSGKSHHPTVVRDLVSGREFLVQNFDTSALEQSSNQVALGGPGKRDPTQEWSVTA
ncbi:hypothetical protein RFI_15630 [Reticulomyxa filosa]|uniref:Uncharacterized protein n=1 Tax=Reticulomyxa filosa TaxID=46433 RepID=X6N747_RETFI|nr:hypothetical protein RFI_15630 [Reticulomyxa filosa]|eukprot:ETO21574.1 hypothetical protein RFI_15630 [Reticulomyxa filosa]